MNKFNKLTIKNIVILVICSTIGFLFYKRYTILLPNAFEEQKYFTNDFALGVLSLFVVVFLYLLLTNIKSLAKYIKNLFKSEMPKKNDNIFKRVGICLINLIAAVGMGLLLLVGVYSIPLDKIDYNVGQSSFTIYQEGSFYSMFDWSVSALDNYTDSLIMLEAAYESDESTLNNALIVRNGSFNGEPFPETMVRHYIYNEWFSAEEYTSDYTYPRYWHGNLVFVKPLLTIFTYSQIRLLNLGVQVLLMLVILLLMYKKGFKKYIIPYSLVYLMLNPIVNGFSLQYSSCYYVANIALLIMLLIGKDKINKYDYLIFFNIGIATSYYDFLTYPYITFAIPFAFYLIFNNEDKGKNKIINFIRLGIIWSLGYLLMWGSKWVLASILTDQNVIADALNMLSYRTSSTDFSFDQITVLNYILYLMQPATLICAAYIVYCYIKRGSNFNWDTILPFVLILIIPILWYSLVKNHSYLHYRFTFKGCTASMIALLFGATTLLRDKNETK